MSFPSRWLAVLVLLLVIAGGATLRIYVTFSNPAFDHQRPEGLLMSDPALLFYITQRIVDNGGLPPEDFRADLRVEHPQPTDLPAMFTVGQEFYLAWGYRLFGKGFPLHVYIVIAMGLFAALAAIGVYGLARELTGSHGWAAFSALAYAVTLANYRTLGFILIREDFSLPLFALHLWLAARAVRVRTPTAHVLSALALLAAVATWHAMVFVVAIEMAAIFAWYLRTGENPLSAKGAWLVPAILVAGALIIPVLRAKWFVLSLPMQLLGALTLMAVIERRRPMGQGLRLAVALGAWLIMVSLFLRVAPQDYGHVFELIWSKLIYLGMLPDDPNRLSFGTRLLWQGPFATASPGYVVRQLGFLGLLLIVVFWGVGSNWLHGRGDGRLQVLLAFAALSIFFAIFVKRLLVLSGLVAPVVAALIFFRFRRPWCLVAGAVTLALQVAVMAIMLPVSVRTSWYLPEHSRNLKQFINWTRVNLDDNGAMASDYVNASAILAHTRHPVVIEPKYETRSSRDRIERFLSAFYYGSPENLHALLEAWDCRYLLVDVYLMSVLRYQAGYPVWQKPVVGLAAEAFLSPWEDRYQAVPGFRLIYLNEDRPPTWRLYQLE